MEAKLTNPVLRRAHIHAYLADAAHSGWNKARKASGAATDKWLAHNRKCKTCLEEGTCAEDRRLSAAADAATTQADKAEEVFDAAWARSIAADEKVTHAMVEC